MIRTLTPADAADMARLHAASFESGWPDTDMAGHAQNDIALGYFEKEALRGLVLARMAAEQSEILTIAVDKNSRSNGLGAKLLMACEAAIETAGGHVIFLEVAEDNFAAMALYRKAGYEGFGRRPAYYKRAGGRVAAMLFQKKL